MCAYQLMLYVSFRACSEGLGRVQYGGDLLAIAKLMEACCPGGVNIIHLSTFSLLDLARLPRDVTVVHMGKHKIKAPQSSRERLTTEPGFPIEINVSTYRIPSLPVQTCIVYIMSHARYTCSMYGQSA